jgi:hypothetical protein
MSQDKTEKPASPEVKERLEAIIRKGLVQGIGEPAPGHCCVMAAINLSLGNPHGDKAPCVHTADRALQIQMNDKFGGGALARAELMLPIALKSLDTAGKGRSVWAKYIAEQTIRRILPQVLRKVGLSDAADCCEREGSLASDRAAVEAIGPAADYAADAVAYAACAVADRAYTAADRAAAASDYYAAGAEVIGAAADADADAADAAADAVAYAATVTGPEVWTTFQQIVLEAYELETEK